MILHDADGKTVFTLWAPNLPGEAIRIDTGDPQDPVGYTGGHEWPSDAGMTRDEWLTACCKHATIVFHYKMYWTEVVGAKLYDLSYSFAADKTVAA